MSRENPLWGAPRVHGELLKLGIDIGETSVGKYMVRRRNPPSQTWPTFLNNHVKTMVSVDFLPCRRSGFRSSMYFSSWPMIEGELCISTSPLILLPSGLGSNCEKRFRLIKHHSIFFAIGIGSLGRASTNRCRRWVSSKCYPLHAHLGKEPT